jgi:hypothetical protein
MESFLTEHSKLATLLVVDREVGVVRLSPDVDISVFDSFKPVAVFPRMPQHPREEYRTRQIPLTVNDCGVIGGYVPVKSGLRQVRVFKPLLPHQLDHVHLSH